MFSPASTWIRKNTSSFLKSLPWRFKIFQDPHILQYETHYQLFLFRRSRIWRPTWRFTGRETCLGRTWPARATPSAPSTSPPTPMLGSCHAMIWWLLLSLQLNTNPHLRYVAETWWYWTYVVLVSIFFCFLFNMTNHRDQVQHQLQAKDTEPNMERGFRPGCQQCRAGSTNSKNWQKCDLI